MSYNVWQDPDLDVVALVVEEDGAWRRTEADLSGATQEQGRCRWIGTDGVGIACALGVERGAACTSPVPRVWKPWVQKQQLGES